MIVLMMTNTTSENLEYAVKAEQECTGSISGLQGNFSQPLCFQTGRKMRCNDVYYKWSTSFLYKLCKLVDSKR